MQGCNQEGGDWLGAGTCSNTLFTNLNHPKGASQFTSSLATQYSLMIRVHEMYQI
jgi:hypothetical protein